MSLLSWIVLLAAALAGFFLLQLLALAVVLGFEDQHTTGLGYYGRPPAERAGYRHRLRRQARLLAPILAVLGRVSRFDFAKVSFRHRGIAGPKGTCSRESFERAELYRPSGEDVFVATQMKCGTTWMLHLVYQVLRRGAGDLVESGTALHAVCPWLEGRKTVALGDAPLVGSERPSRIIKTHFPVSLCPYTPEARYLYVVRHPVSCFASCADFIAENAGRLAPRRELIEQWFCSDELMWWGTWPAHVEGWWQLSQQRSNVLFVSFEEMKRDLAGVVRQVAGFLGQPLGEGELAQVVKKCGFAYMQEHQEAFEMHPPQLLGADAELFVRGTADRHRDVPEAMRQRLLAWTATRLQGAEFPLERFYPGVR
ncbi:MAG TPA: sulfotransferase domain-containing protein [Gemmatimonadales bacterium]|nr:sulfotransferase domain-containing protein [Gemmatimonadales bacterium]